jgi:hypothetical protein
MRGLIRPVLFFFLTGSGLHLLGVITSFTHTTLKLTVPSGLGEVLAAIVEEGRGGELRRKKITYGVE